MRDFFQPSASPAWLGQVLNSIRAALGDIWPSPLRLKDYPVAELPDAERYKQGIIFVPDESGGATVAFSDGTHWRRAADRAVVS